MHLKLEIKAQKVSQQKYLIREAPKAIHFQGFSY